MRAQTLSLARILPSYWDREWQTGSGVSIEGSGSRNGVSIELDNVEIESNILKAESNYSRNMLGAGLYLNWGSGFYSSSFILD